MANSGGFYPKKQTQKTYYEVRKNVTLIDGLNQFDITDLLVGKITNWTNGIVAIDKSLFRVEVINGNGSVMLPEIKVINNYTYGFDATAQTNATVSVHYEGDLGAKEVIIPSYNFDITMDWSILLDVNGQLYPVTNQATFTQWLTNGSDSFGEASSDFINIVITDFVKVGNNIKCNLTATSRFFSLPNNTITNADKIGIINGLEVLFLYNNQIANFNPTIPLPSSLQILVLNNNQFTLAGYTATEAWANSLPVSTGKTISFQGNSASVSGTNLEAILISKGWTIEV
jgi:hypothetical protein